MRQQDRVISRDHGWAMAAGLVLAGSALIALAAQITVPMFPVPMTLQTMAISLLGVLYGPRLAMATVLAYLGEGALGLPVFAGGGAGPASLIGPTAGFLWGFLGLAWLTGWLVHKGPVRGVPGLVLGVILPAMLLYLPGTAVVAAFTGLDPMAAATVAALPFIPGDLVKSVAVVLFVIAGRGIRIRG